MKINENEIQEEYLGCPYCGDEVSMRQLGCCGESRQHFITHYVVDGCGYPEEEIEIA